MQLLIFHSYDWLQLNDRRQIWRNWRNYNDIVNEVVRLVYCRLMDVLINFRSSEKFTARYVFQLWLAKVKVYVTISWRFFIVADIFGRKTFFNFRLLLLMILGTLLD